MEDSEIMTDSEMTEIPDETTAEETTIIQEVTEEPTITELLTSTETISTTTTECLTYANLEKLNVDMLNNFTYLGTFFIIFVILIIVFKGVYRLFNIFF